MMNLPLSHKIVFIYLHLMVESAHLVVQSINENLDFEINTFVQYVLESFLSRELDYCQMIIIIILLLIVKDLEFKSYT